MHWVIKQLIQDLEADATERGKWYDIRKQMPELIDGESEEVLCMTRKFGHSGTKHNTPFGYALLWWDGNKWEGWEVDDFESNPDYYAITHWMYIPKVEW